MCDMIYSRFRHSAAVAGNFLYAIGGHGIDHTKLHFHEHGMGDGMKNIQNSLKNILRPIEMLDLVTKGAKWV